MELSNCERQGGITVGDHDGVRYTYSRLGINPKSATISNFERPFQMGEEIQLTDCSTDLVENKCVRCVVEVARVQEDHESGKTRYYAKFPSLPLNPKSGYRKNEYCALSDLEALDKSDERTKK